MGTVTHLERGVSLETGELGILVPEGQGYKIISPKQQIGYLKRLQKETGRQEGFTFSDMERMQDVISVISESHCGYLLLLQTYIDYDTNVLVVGQKKTPMSKRDMQTVLGTKDTAFKRFFSEMKKHGIIIENSEGHFSINRNFHFRGPADNRKVIKSFSSKVRNLYADCKAQDLGLVYKLLPYVHYETNTICRNPYETSLDRIEPFNLEDIAKLMSSTERSIYSKLRNLKLGDMYVFAQISGGRSTFYKINPFIFYRKDGKPDSTLREIFLLVNNYRKKQPA